VNRIVGKAVRFIIYMVITVIHSCQSEAGSEPVTGFILENGKYVVYSLALDCFIKQIRFHPSGFRIYPIGSVSPVSKP